jgi:hypothetical protein
LVHGTPYHEAAVGQFDIPAQKAGPCNIALGRPIFPLSPLGEGFGVRVKLTLTLSLSQRERVSLLASLS